MSLAFLCNFDLFFYFSIESVFHCDFPKFGLQICKWFQKWDLLHLHWMYGQRRQRKWQLCCRVSKQAQCLKITKKSHFTKLTKDQSLTVWFSSNETLLLIFKDFVSFFSSMTGFGYWSHDVFCRFGVCCLFIYTGTSSTINQNCSYIQSPGFPSTFTASTASSLTYTIQKCSNGKRKI